MAQAADLKIREKARELEELVQEQEERAAGSEISSDDDGYSSESSYDGPWVGARLWEFGSY